MRRLAIDPPAGLCCALHRRRPWPGAPWATAWSAIWRGRQLTPAAARGSARACWPANPIRPWPASPTGPTTLRDNDPERCQADLALALRQLSRAATATTQPPRDCPDGNCVIAAIEPQRAILADRTPSAGEARRDALKFLVHFVGDVHQPLHASNARRQGRQRFPGQPAHRRRTGQQPAQASRWRDGHDPALGLGLRRAGRMPTEAAARDRRCRMPTPTPQFRPPPHSTGRRESCRLVDARQLYPARAHASTTLSSTRSVRWPNAACARPAAASPRCSTTR